MTAPLVGPAVMVGGLPPYEMRCLACGLVWIPTPAKGRAMTDHRLQAECDAHQCEVAS